MFKEIFKWFKKVSAQNKIRLYNHICEKCGIKFVSLSSKDKYCSMCLNPLVKIFENRNHN